jgi:hypothetical protein
MFSNLESQNSEGAKHRNSKQYLQRNKEKGKDLLISISKIRTLNKSNEHILHDSLLIGK